MPARHTTSGIRSGGSPVTVHCRTTVDGPSPGSRSRSSAVPVRISVRVEAQAGARADLEQRDRPVDAAQCGQQRSAPQRFIRLQAADRALRDHGIGVSRNPLRPFAVRAFRSTQHARDGEHERRLPVRRRDAAEDRGHRAIGGDSRGPLGVQLRSARRLVAREASVAVGDLGGDGMRHPSSYSRGEPAGDREPGGDEWG